MTDFGGEKPQKVHRARQAGGKLAKKKKAEAQASIADQRAKAQRNPKAFTCQSGKRAERAAQRNMDLEEKRLHVPLVDRTSSEPPPMVVAVVGPPQVGKSTLIRCLVKRFTKHNLGEIKGPVTVVAGKKRRITFMECANDINSMIDVAKIADLVLLMIDGSFGFEMETFEFLNILQSHGFPKIIGVLTHLDGFKDNKRLKKTKKKLKQRFWTEIYDGAKLFYLSGMINGKYLKNEILNLSRFISIMKFRPLVWRNQHPYLLVDRIEDTTNPESVRVNPKISRKISVYGYVRGTQFKPDQKIHIPGVGDQVIKEISLLDDPCPLPRSFEDPMKKARKRLSEKERLLYAPMTDVTGIVYDKDAVYINIPDNIYRDTGNAADGAKDQEFESDAEFENEEGDAMLNHMQKANTALDENLEESGLQIFNDSAPIRNFEIDESNGRQRRKVLFGDEVDLSDGDEEDEGEVSEESEAEDNESFDDDCDQAEERSRKDVEEGDQEDMIAYEDTASELSEDDYDQDAWKKNMDANLKANLQSKRINLMKEVYDLYDSEIDDEENVQELADKGSNKSSDPDSLFYKVHDVLEKKSSGKKNINLADTSVFQVSQEALEKYRDEPGLDSLRNRFITGELKAKGAIADNDEDDEAVYGDFEDLETGERHESDPAAPSEPNGAESVQADELRRKKEQLKLKFDEEYDGKFDQDDADGGEEADSKPDTYYDIIKKDMQRQKDLNQEVLSQLDVKSRLQMEGYASGSYVRITMENVPCELIENFSPLHPLILGGLLGTEDQYGFVQVRVKRHRWFRKILKSNDPIIVSLGWRRFQTLPVYSLCTDGSRNRMLKYTPEHMHCNAVFYGPVTPVNTGFCAFQSVKSSGTSNFRVCATGVVCDLSHSPEIVKKLKLTGVPFKVMRKTAFIKDMFSSALEVAKFEGASIRTVSGLRGQIKKAMRVPEGGFRATFEDKILMSDIVFLRTWYPVTPKTYYNPVTSLLESDKSSGWSGMRLTRDVRKEKSLPVPNQSDSHYKAIERPLRRFNPLRIPKSLQSDLPFASKPKLLKARSSDKSNKKGYLANRAQLLEPEEKQTARLLVHLHMIQKEKEKKRQAKSQADRVKYLKRRAEQDVIDERKEREKKRRIMKSAAMKRGKSSSD